MHQSLKLNRHVNTPHVFPCLCVCVCTGYWLMFFFFFPHLSDIIDNSHLRKNRVLDEAQTEFTSSTPSCGALGIGKSGREAEGRRCYDIYDTAALCFTQNLHVRNLTRTCVGQDSAIFVLVQCRMLFHIHVAIFFFFFFGDVINYIDANTLLQPLKIYLINKKKTNWIVLTRI